MAPWKILLEHLHCLSSCQADASKSYLMLPFFKENNSHSGGPERSWGQTGDKG